MFRVAFVAFVAIGGKLLEPATDIFFGGVVPFGIGLQTQVDAHLWVLFLAHRSLRDFTSTLAFVSRYRFGQFSGGMQFVIERFDICGAEEEITPYTTIWLDAAIFHPLFERHAVYTQSLCSLACVDKSEPSTSWFAYHVPVPPIGSLRVLPLLQRNAQSIGIIQYS